MIVTNREWLTNEEGRRNKIFGINQKIEKESCISKELEFCSGGRPTIIYWKSCDLVMHFRRIAGYGSLFDSGEFYINFCCHPNVDLLPDYTLV